MFYRILEFYLLFYRVTLLLHVACTILGQWRNYKIRLYV